MTRNLITELVIRLLALCLFFRSIALLLSRTIYMKDGGLSFCVNVALFIPFFGITILIIFFSERISKLIWMDKITTDEIINESMTPNILVPLISILGLYFIIGSLASIIHGLADIFVISPGEFARRDSYSYYISTIIYQCIFLIFGILLFYFPDKLITIRDDLKKIFKREKINYENLEEE